MTQKITSLLLLLVSCIFAANAQTIASEPTTDLTDGYYVIKLKSNDNKADENGNYMYYNADDSRVYYEEKGSTTQLIGTENTNADMMKYLFKVTKSGDKYTISAWGTSKFFPSIPKATYSTSFGQPGKNPGNQDQFTLSNSSAKFTPIATTGSWYAMKTVGTYYEKRKVKDIDIYIILNDKQHIGYWENAINGENYAQFQFYAATNVPEASDLVTITYNYKLNDVVKGSYTTNMAVIGKTFPTPKDVPAYVDFENFPTRNVTAEDNNQTFDLACTIATPFQISDDSKKHYYYLRNSNDTKTRLFANGGNLKFREDAQAEILNNVNGDLWYVTGNPFDGFQFHNVGANETATSSQIPSNTGAPRCRLAFSGTAGENVWYIYKFDDNSFGLYRYSNWVIGSGNVAWNYNNEYVQFDKIDLNALPTEKSYAFTLTPATVTLPLNYSKADNANFATTCLPYAVKVANAEGTVKTYAGKLNAEQTGLEMNEVSAVPANQGIIIKGNATDEEVKLRVIDAAEAIDNDLKGTTEELTDLTGVYSFGRANGTGNVGFFRSTKPTLVANRAYIQLDNSASQSIAMNFDGNIVSSIESVNNNNATMSNAPVFDLTGRRVMKMVKGNLYIQNGRKFIAQ